MWVTVVIAQPVLPSVALLLWQAMVVLPILAVVAMVMAVVAAVAGTVAPC